MVCVVSSVIYCRRHVERSALARSEAVNVTHHNIAEACRGCRPQQKASSNISSVLQRNRVTWHVIIARVSFFHFHYFRRQIWLSRIYSIPLIDRARQDDYNGGLINIFRQNYDMRWILSPFCPSSSLCRRIGYLCFGREQLLPLIQLPPPIIIISSRRR